MNKPKSALLIPLAVLIIFLMTSWEEGQINVLTAAGGLAVSILLYIVITELIKGIHSFGLNMSRNETIMAEQMKELREAITNNSLHQTECLEKNHHALVGSLENLQQKLELQKETDKEQATELKLSLNAGMDRLYGGIMEQRDGLNEASKNILEQQQSLQQLAQTIKDHGQELQTSFFHNLSSYKEGLHGVITMIGESAVQAQKEIVNQSGEQVKRMEDVMEMLKNDTSSFHEKLDDYLISAHSTTMDAQQKITESTMEQSRNLEALSVALKNSFEEMQDTVAKRIQDQYTAVTVIVEQLKDTVEGTQSTLSGYVKEQVANLNEMVKMTKTETAKSLQELKTQGEAQHKHMQRFLIESKDEALKTRGSMDQHHQELLRKLEGELATIVHQQKEENKVNVQRTSDVITQFSNFHQELIAEHQKQLQETVSQQQKLTSQVDHFKEMLIPLTELHHNLQEMSKEEYRKLYDTMGLLSSSLVDTIESKNSLRTHIVRMQDEMLQKLR